MATDSLPSERWLTPRNARLTLLALGLVTLAALFALRHVRLDYDFEKFFPQDDPELDRYLAFRERFGHDNDFIMLGITHRPTVFERAFLLKVDSLRARLQRLPAVLSATSPTDLNDPRFMPFGVFEVPWLRLQNDTRSRSTRRGSGTMPSCGNASSTPTPRPCWSSSCASPTCPRRRATP